MRISVHTMHLMLVLALFIALLTFSHVGALREAADGSVCFNDCNGHGECIDYSCFCHPGYLGDDCGTTFADESNIIPILTAGHFNVTRKNITQTISKHPVLLIGFSSYSCHKCIAAEPVYEQVTEALAKRKIPFARADAEKLKSFAAEFGALELPSLVLTIKMRPVLYKGVHSIDAIMKFIDKQTGPPVVRLNSVAEVQNFLSSRSKPEFSLSAVMTVGFFSEHEDIEEDEYEEFVTTAKELQTNEDLYFAVVTDRKICKAFKQNKTIDRTPSVLMLGESEVLHSINIDELFGEKMGLKEWITAKSIPLVGKITNKNFALYEKANKPMLLMFLDLTHEFATDTYGIIGGKSGGVLNEALLDELRLVAKEYDKILFGYLDGTQYEDQMKSLGLYGGRERLPSIAFNTRDGTKVPFPEDLPINYETLTQFCADFLLGKLRTATDLTLMKSRALQRVATSQSNKNYVTRKKRKAAPEVVQGVAEQFGDGRLGDEYVKNVNLTNFDDIVMNEEKDVVLLLHAQECEKCAHFAVYFKRMAMRFGEMNLPTLTIARMDVTNDSPPAHYQLMVGPLPLMLMLPVGRKHSPWTFYSGVGKVQQMMKWVQSNVGVDFTLPNLPHLTPKERELYKQQVREREEYLEKKRQEEAEALREEERAQEELKRRYSQRSGGNGEVDGEGAAVGDAVLETDSTATMPILDTLAGISSLEEAHKVVKQEENVGVDISGDSSVERDDDNDSDF
ncbi:hypothetical protein EON65_39880 [archaeon]|nr:MAG: hypothetical protein EON65_39880 [archaeon]